MKLFTSALILGAIALVTGCASTYDAQRGDISGESSIVFTRAPEYKILDSKSAWRFFEVTYETFSLDPVGQPIVEVGLKYTGGSDWRTWQTKSPQTVALMATCAFYGQPDRQGPILYTTPRIPLTFKLGEITPIKFVAPVKNAHSHQIVIGR